MSKKKEKKPEVKKPEVEEPKVEVESKSKARRKARSKQKVEKLEDLGTLGLQKMKILKLDKKVVNGREYNDVHLINGQTFLLSDKDLKRQLN